MDMLRVITGHFESKQKDHILIESFTTTHFLSFLIAPLCVYNICEFSLQM